MAENIRKQIEKELTSLKENADKFGSAVEIVDEAKKITTAADEMIKKTFSQNQKAIDNASNSLTDLVQNQEKQLEKLNKDLSKLTDLQKQLSETDIPNRLNELGTILGKVNDDIHSQFKTQKAIGVKILDILTDLTKEFKTYQTQSLEDKIELLKQIEVVKNGTTILRNNQKSNHQEIKNLHLNSSSELSNIIKSDNKDLKKEVNTNRTVLISLVTLIIIVQIVLFFVGQ